jgi:hypothetical protein
MSNRGVARTRRLGRSSSKISGVEKRHASLSLNSSTPSAAVLADFPHVDVLFLFHKVEPSKIVLVVETLRDVLAELISLRVAAPVVKARWKDKWEKGRGALSADPALLEKLERIVLTRTKLGT